MDMVKVLEIKQSVFADNNPVAPVSRAKITPRGQAEAQGDLGQHGELVYAAAHAVRSEKAISLRCILLALPFCRGPPGRRPASVVLTA